MNETGATAAPEMPLQTGATLGRYVILEQIGAGSMGIVYSAYDPQLGRKVALKLLRPSAAASFSAGEPGGQLLREAQAMALLSHPNIVTVHDVGTFGAQIFLAMEFIEGETLGAWMRRAPRGWREVLPLFLQAGKGLQAAHEAGLIHRDFKPDNVLIGRDGRARVTDFGLARALGQAPRDSSLAVDSAPVHAAVRLGTPAYMSPEQREGKPLDARADLFSFCTALHEGLHGARPGLREPEPKRRVPGWLDRIVQGGLLPDREARCQTMAKLLAALEKGPLFSPSHIGLAATALLALTAGGWGAFAAWQRPPPCSGAEQAWGDAWDANHREAARAAFARSGRGGAAERFAQLAGALDAYRDHWTALHKQICLATGVSREQSDALLDVRMGCLAERRRDAAALVDLLAKADGEIVDESLKAVSSLPTADACATTKELEVPLPADAGMRSEIARLYDELARAEALAYAGKLKEGLALTRPAVAQAQALGHAPLLARFELVLGTLEMDLSSGNTAEESLHRAAIAAERAHDDGTAADAFSLLIWVLAGQQGRRQEAETMARYAEAAIIRLGGDDAREAERLADLARVISDESRLDEIEPLLQRSLALFTKSRGPDYWRIAGVEQSLGNLQYALGRPAEALAIHRKSSALRARLFAPDHPAVISSMASEASDLIVLGRPAEALALYRRGEELAARNAGEGENDYFARCIGSCLRAQGDFAGALAEDRRSIAIAQRNHETDFRMASKGEGEDLLALGRFSEAKVSLERALQMTTPENGATELAEEQFALAKALWGENRDRARAVQLAQSAREGYAGFIARYHASWQDKLAEIDAWLKSVGH